MIGAIIVTLFVYAIVASYMGIVNRMLRSDEHWGESNQVQPTAKATAPAFSYRTASSAHA